ncbi:protein IQ-DOMAIN 14 [Senna tora]|uniref:Protein IQ-DOMAIN 14 n=1 Tax=Senna tora TaxID=362788 RepID=A0A834SUV1_9FABA|nr:protein IQ-DOMAIN 14 [Senna tora]
MGKASRWFRSLLGLKKPDSSSTTTIAAASAQKPPKDKRRWSFVKSYRESTYLKTDSGGHHHHAAFEEEAVRSSSGDVVDGVYPDRHAMAVAAAAVVRLTSGGSGRGPVGIENREEWAAVMIQAAFRGCLARKALRALKGVVKLQALVKGHIVRKQNALKLQRMEALIRAQARGPATPEKSESPIRYKSMKFDPSLSIKRNGTKSHEQSWNQPRSSLRKSSVDDERSIRILEVDPGKLHLPKHRTLFHSSTHPIILHDNYSQSLDSKTHQSGHSTSSCEAQSYTGPLKLDDVVESPFRDCNNNNSVPKISPFTPTRSSDDSRSYLSGYSDNPSYMAYTESSKAKVRSVSAPKQRPSQYERSCSSSNLHLVQPSGGELRLNPQRSFTAKAYPGSGRLDKFGMPVGQVYFEASARIL